MKSQGIAIVSVRLIALMRSERSHNTSAKSVIPTVTRTIIDAILTIAPLRMICPLGKATLANNKATKATNIRIVMAVVTIDQRRHVDSGAALVGRVSRILEIFWVCL